MIPVFTQSWRPLRSIRRLVSVFLISLGITGSAGAGEEFIFAISSNPGTLQHSSAQEFTRLANERLASKARIKFFGSAQLGDDKQLMQKLKLGTVHIALPSSTMSSVADEFGIFEMPFLVKDRAHLTHIENEVFWDEIAPAAEKKGYKLIALWENGVRHITNNKRPIYRPEDLSDLKLRTPKSKWRVNMFKAWGANPTPMAYSEVFVALQTGVIDGQENPFANIWASKLPEVQKFLTVTGHVYSPAYPTMGKRTYDKMDPEIRSILVKTAREVAVWARRKGAAEDESLKARLRVAGMQVNQADHESFASASNAVYAQFIRELPAGQSLINKVRSLDQ